MKSSTLAPILALVAIIPVAVVSAAAQADSDRVLRVTSAADDGGSGTLRWAIETSNSTPDGERIEINLDARPPVITLTAPLPPVKGPVSIEGVARKRTGEYAVIDGSGYVRGDGPEQCPGAAPGQFGANVRTMTSPGLQLIDTADVEIAGVEIRRFCIGILINRSMRVTIRDSRIAENRGGAGVMLTGDDGQGNSTTTTIHNRVLRTEFADNGDGLELTRGAAFNLIAGNVFRSTPANPEPAQGIEILRGNDNVVSGNRFEGYSDGLQINWGDRNYIVANEFNGNTFGLSLTGVANIVDSNLITANRIGIVVRPADPAPLVRLTRNRITANGRDILRCEAGGSCDPATPTGAIVFGLPGLEHEGFVGSRGGGVTPNPATLQSICPKRAPRCQPDPHRGVMPPTITGAHATGTELTVTGVVTGMPSSRYALELFGNTDAKTGEAEIFLDETPVYTDAAGAATFIVRVAAARASRNVRSVTATVTSEAGATSPLSAAKGVAETSSQ